MNKRVKTSINFKKNVRAARLALFLKPWVPKLILKDLIYTISAKIFSAAVKLKALALASSAVAQARLILGLPDT